MNSYQPRSRLVLNAVALCTDWNASVRVGRLGYVDSNGLEQIRGDLGSGYVAKRRGPHIVVAAVKSESTIRADDHVNLRLGDVTDLLVWRLSEWLIEHLAPMGRQLFRRRRSLVVVSDRPEDNLLQSVMPQETSLPEGIAFQAAFELAVRIERPGGKPRIFLTIDSRTRPRIDTPVNELLTAGISVNGLYVRRANSDRDPRLADHGRLTGRVKSVDGPNLVLADHDEGWPTIPACKARLEPRMEVLARLLSQICPAAGSSREVLEKLRERTKRISIGKEKPKTSD